MEFDRHPCTTTKPVAAGGQLLEALCVELPAQPTLDDLQRQITELRALVMELVDVHRSRL
jgi:hypothetical protein